jgi:two-component system, chemotaxis family, protein-glutamate methylesterase/glutaminase
MVIVQSPQDAEQPQLPLNALECVEADYVLAASDMAAVLAGMVKESVPERFKLSNEELKRLKMEVIIATRDNAFEMGIIDMGEPTQYTCPECSGALVRLAEGKIIRFRCHTGHAYTASSLVAEVSESVEGLLWKSMRGMEEMNLLLDHIGKHYETLNNAEAAALFRAKAKESAEHARIIHESVFRQQQYSEDIRFDPGPIPGRNPFRRLTISRKISHLVRNSPCRIARFVDS